MTPLSTLGQAALKYMVLGFHPIPCVDAEKKARVKWEEFQATAPTAEQITKWWTLWPNANVALVMGRGVCAIDLDGDGAEALLNAVNITLPPTAPRVKTGSGAHVYLAVNRAMPNRAALLTRNGGKPQVDIRGDAGYVLAPPSKHPNGSRYMWSQPLVHPLPEMPAALVALILRGPQAMPRPSAGMQRDAWVTTALQGVEEGGRDAACTRLAGYFLSIPVAADIVCGLLEAWGQRCRPPFAAYEVRKCVESVARRESRKPRPSSEGEESTAPIVTHISTAIERLHERIAAPEQTVIPVPFPKLSWLLDGGFRPGELIYLGARRSTGKSALALEFARHATRHGHTTLIVSLESGEEQLAARVIAQEGKHSASALRTMRGLTDEVRCTEANLRERPLWITAAHTALEIVAALEAITSGVDFLVMDYLQLLRAPREIRERRGQVEWLSKALKRLAVTRRIPVLCISSVSRSADNSEDRAPTMSSLRESGELEHDADIIALLHRKPNELETECNVAKNRDGKTGMVHLVFRPESVSFRELETEHDDVEVRGGWK